jgi:hypothetical protein
MDIFAHFLWTFAIYWQHPKRWLAGFIGMVPDLLAFGPVFIMNIFTGHRGVPSLSSIPSYVYAMYNITHSLVTFTILALILWFAARKWFWLLGGWLLHIIIDVPTHTNAFFPTPFLWPISTLKFSGISWGTPWFMLANYSSLFVLYAWMVWKVPMIKPGIA